MSSVHKCEKANGGCEQICTPDGEKAICSCEPAEDFILKEDGTCEKSKFFFRPNTRTTII